MAVSKTGANATVIYVPPKFAPDAVMEAADAGIEVIVCITEWIPVIDMVKVYTYVKSRGSILIGPNCPGVITPGARCRMGVMPYRVHREGTVGIISRSGTLTYEAVGQLGALGLGESTVIGIGGDPIIGSKFIDLMRLYRDDPDTEAVVLIGEIGGTAEEDAATYITEEAYPKPVIGFVAGLTAPPGRRMGHAGAIISGGQGGAKEKIAAMKKAGIHVVETPADIGETVLKALKTR
jgi:succinyl-CoA synthetase alpha subunit